VYSHTSLLALDFHFRTLGFDAPGFCLGPSQVSACFLWPTVFSAFSSHAELHLCFLGSQADTFDSILKSSNSLALPRWLTPASWAPALTNSILRSLISDCWLLWLVLSPWSKFFAYRLVDTLHKGSQRWLAYPLLQEFNSLSLLARQFPR
jgi:hypothetical protein